MPHLTQTARAYLSAALIVTAGCQLSAFEQGTYFIFQLVEQSDKPAIENRLAVNSQLFAKAETTAVPSTAEVSEFEMDYTSLGTTKNSYFESTQTYDTDLDTTSQASTFDIGTQETISLFGN